MNSHSQDSWAGAKALASGLVVPILLIAAFLACARGTSSTAPRAASTESPATTAVSPVALTPAAPAPAPSPIAAKAPAARLPVMAAAAPVAHSCSKARVTTRVAVAPHAAVMAVIASMDGSSYGYSNDDNDRDFFWALVEARNGRGRTTIGTTDDRAQEAISRALRQQRGKFLYLRLDDQDYIVRDPETIARASRQVEPMQELGRKMGELGGRQGQLGGRQGELGGLQGQLGARQAELAMRQASLGMKIHARERRGLSTAELEREQERIDAEMRQCSRQQNELGRRQSELGARQSVLGAEQSRYGEEMSRVSREVEKAMRKLAREATDSGLAKELDDTDA